MAYGVRRIAGAYVEACDECGFDGGRVADDVVADTLRSQVREWTEVLGADEVMLRKRPQPETWCALEYADHVATAWPWLGDLLSGAIEPAPAPPMSDPAEPDDCDAHSIEELCARIGRAIDPFVAMAVSVAGRSEAHRPVSVGPFDLDVAALLRHGLHDTGHHLLDVRRGLATLRLREGDEVVHVGG